LTAAVKDAGRAGIAGVVEEEVVVVVVDAGAGMAFVVEVGIAVGASVAAALRVSWNVCDTNKEGYTNRKWRALRPVVPTVLAVMPWFIQCVEFPGNSETMACGGGRNTRL
jgi:hypothetical protein